MKLFKIKNFDKYFINENGEVFSNWKGKMKKMNPWLDTRGNYLIIGLVKNGKRYRKSIHRLVVQNVQGLEIKKGLVVDHIDGNKTNNHFLNLRIVTQKDNVNFYLKGTKPIRNFIKCSLFVDNLFVKNFDSIKDACSFASAKYKISFTSLMKNKKCKNIFISKV